MVIRPPKTKKKLDQSRKVRAKPHHLKQWLIGASISLVLLVIAGSIFVAQQLTSLYAARAEPNPDCTLIIPTNPLTVEGLTTPYQLIATDRDKGQCHEANKAQSAFVQAVILDPANGQMTAYEPLVIDRGTQPAIPPVPVTLPPNAIVGIWFGDNGTTLTLQRNTQTKGGGHHKRNQMHMQGGNNGNCVNGSQDSPFGQFGYCNAALFFQTARKMIDTGTIKVPALGTAIDGQTCPTTQDFSIVDMDQSDNVQTQYLANDQGQMAQFSASNQEKLKNANVIANPSDNALLSQFVDPALGCTAWQIMDQVSQTPVATYGTDALQAITLQKAPVALIPAGNPMVLVDEKPNLLKTNLYRVGAGEAPAASLAEASTKMYCQNLLEVAVPRLLLDMRIFAKQASPDGGVATNSLFTFLANRLNASLGEDGLNCTGLLKIQNPVSLTTNDDGIVTAATFSIPARPADGDKDSQ